MARVLIIVVLAVAAYMASGMPQQGGQQLPPPPTDPQLLQDCEKQKAECEKQQAQGYQSAGPIQNSPLGQVTGPIQNSTSGIINCDRQFDMCKQGKLPNLPTNGTGTPPAGGTRFHF